MQLVGFRIKDYRSIVDTRWVSVSNDGITAIVGQNESGKTNLLDALRAFETGVLSEGDLRSDDSIPEVSCRYRLTGKPSDYLSQRLLDPGVDREVEDRGGVITLSRTWNGELEPLEISLDSDLSDLCSCVDEREDCADPEPNPDLASAEELCQALLAQCPRLIMFDEDESFLPNTISVQQVLDNNPAAEGLNAVLNFLKVACLDTSALRNRSQDRRLRKKLSDASDFITEDFRSFWSQRIGGAAGDEAAKVSFSCEHRCQDSQCGNPGDPFLEFWVKDSDEELHLGQRSRGMQWFLSFYLQLKASAMDLSKDGRPCIFLIDEPGAHLHARAQKNVLDLLESVRNATPIIYSTHSPFLINVRETGRLLVVERDGKPALGNPTVVYGSHEFGAANSDSLLPIYSAIGVDLSHQRVVQKANNVLLEEMSSYYYLRAFWLLTAEESPVHFLPATGATNVHLYANLFTAWGLDYVVMVDNDVAGKRAIRKIRDTLFNGRLEDSRRQLLLLPVEGRIEDIFSNRDYRRFVLCDESAAVPASNGEHAKKANLRKGAAALGFCNKVVDGAVHLTDFEEATRENIRCTVSALTSATSFAPD